MIVVIFCASIIGWVAWVAVASPASDRRAIQAAWEGRPGRIVDITRHGSRYSPDTMIWYRVYEVVFTRTDAFACSPFETDWVVLQGDEVVTAHDVDEDHLDSALIGVQATLFGRPRVRGFLDEMRGYESKGAIRTAPPDSPRRLPSPLRGCS